MAMASQKFAAHRTAQREGFFWSLVLSEVEGLL
jgi:hypothetical protein